MNSISSDPVTTKLMIETWIWEKEQSHRLFNFQEGYRILKNDEYAGYNKQDYFSGLSSDSTQIDILGCHIIKKNGTNDIVVQKASDH